MGFHAAKGEQQLWNLMDDMWWYKEGLFTIGYLLEIYPKTKSIWAAHSFDILCKTSQFQFSENIYATFVYLLSYVSLNSLPPERFKFDIRRVIFKLTLANGGWGISHEIALRWMPQDLTDDKSTLVQVNASCHQATSHYPSQCWPSFQLLYGVTGP